MLKLSIKGPLTAESAVYRTPGPHAEVWRDSHGQIAAFSEIVGEQYWMHLPGIASFCFSGTKDEVAARVLDHATEDSVLDAYWRKVLPIALQVRGFEVLHASAVSSPGGVTALCGFSETGKSTMAVAFSHRGYRLWADDTVTFEVNGKGPLVISLPFTTRLRPPVIDFLDHPIQRSFSPMDSTCVEKAPLVAICVLHRANSNSETIIRRFSPTKALAALLDHAWCFIPQTRDRKRRMIEHYLKLISIVPVYDISFPSGLDNLSGVLETIDPFISAKGDSNKF
jgi:hypothetical protein